jgi:phage I-like protein
MAFTHNSKLSENEPEWSAIDKTRLPRIAFADQGEPDKKSTWRFPHHWVQDGGGLDENGIYTTGTLYLHRGGLAAARAAAAGARSGQEASAEVRAHLAEHASAIEMGEARENAPQLNFEIPADVPEWVMIARTGRWLGHPAGPEVITPAHLHSALEYFDRHYRANGVDLPIDYHHQSVLAAQGDVSRAPAAGWIKEMALRANGTELWARVQPWVLPARNAIAAREYRYLSPVLMWNVPDRVTGEPVPMIVHSVALTNTPFLTELQSLNHQLPAADGGQRPGRETDHSNEEGENMKLFEVLATALGKQPDQVAETLGLVAGADDKAVAEKVMANAVRLKELEAKAAPPPAPVVNDAVAALLGVAPGSAEPEVKAAIMRLQLNADGAAVRSALGLQPEAKTEEVLARLNELLAARQKSEAEQLVDEAVRAGKVAPANREAVLAFAINDLAAARTLISSLPVQTSMARHDNRPGESGIGLSEDEQRICALLGISHDSYKKAKEM